MRPSAGGGANVGGSSILVIFVLLCITTFAILAMVSATASFRLATQVARAADDYFAAQSQAEEKLAEISRVLAYYRGADVTLQLRELGVLYYDGIITYSVDVNASMRIDVALAVQGTSFQVLTWVQVPIFDPAEYGGGGITLWPGF